MEWVKRLLMGIIIGGAMIIPGVSGGIIMVVLGLYDKVIKILNSFFDDVKDNLFFLMPLSGGILLGILMVGKLLYYLFSSYEIILKWIFLGLILGGIPLLFKRLLKEGNGKIYWHVLIMVVIVTYISLVRTPLSFNLNNNLNVVLLFIAGFLFMIGKIIPGISSSLLLIMIGIYEFYLYLIANFFSLDLTIYLALIPFGLGAILSSLILIKLMGMLLTKYYNLTYSIIIGFIIGSIPSLMVGFTLDVKGLYLIVITVLSFILVNYMCRVLTTKSIV